MKNLFYFLFVAVLMSACGNSSEDPVADGQDYQQTEEESNDGIKITRSQFISAFKESSWQSDSICAIEDDNSLGTNILTDQNIGGGPMAVDFKVLNDSVLVVYRSSGSSYARECLTVSYVSYTYDENSSLLMFSSEVGPRASYQVLSASDGTVRLIFEGMPFNRDKKGLLVLSKMSDEEHEKIIGRWQQSPLYYEPISSEDFLSNLQNGKNWSNVEILAYLPNYGELTGNLLLGMEGFSPMSFTYEDGFVLAEKLTDTSMPPFESKLHEVQFSYNELGNMFVLNDTKSFFSHYRMEFIVLSASADEMRLLGQPIFDVPSDDEVLCFIYVFRSHK